MGNTRNHIIIGAGHNGLITAFYLARAGLKPLVLERRSVVGGACVTEEFHPGFRCSTLATTAAPLLPQIQKDLHLEIELIRPAARATSLNTNGPAVSIYEDDARTAAELKQVSTADANNYANFVATFARLGETIRPLLTMTPPNVDSPSKTELWNLGKLGWAIRGLGKKDEYRLLRYGPMAVADLAAEWFETESLRAMIAARGIFGAFAGPWSAGTSAAVLMQAATDGTAIGSPVFVKGGMGALTQALAKAVVDAGGEIKTDSEVTRIEIANGRVSKVILNGGEEFSTSTVISGADPRATLLKLIDSGELDPSFRIKLQNYRAMGTVAKVNLALSALPSFKGVEDEARLSGRLLIASEIDYLERAFDEAKYGSFSTRPYLDITIPTITDAALAPKGAHVMSVHMQFAPYKLRYAGLRPAETSTPEACVPGDWESQREALGDTVVKTISEFAPNLKDLIVGRQVLTPVDLETKFGMTGGHIHHGEMALDQLFTFRPVIGYAQYRTPIEGLYLCGAGTHPGGGMTGAPGFNASREVIKDLKSHNRER